jgi:alpha-L-fucosidase
MQKKMMTLAAAGMLAFAASVPVATAADAASQPVLAKPTPQQLMFADWELGAFYHFGMSTFTGEAHGLGRGKPTLFNPQSLNTTQWLQCAKAMGAKYAILTARHEDGFCLWPTATTDYSVKSSPWKNGKGDVVREFVDACRATGIEPCLYFSPGFDGHHLFRVGDNPRWGDGVDYFGRMTEAEFAEFTKRDIAQVSELITNYKPKYIWCDHNLVGGRMGELQVAVCKTIKQLAPDCLILGPDIWVVGNEHAHVCYPMWNAVNTKDNTLYSRPRATSSQPEVMDADGLLETDANTGHPWGAFWRNRDAVTAGAFGGWFYYDKMRTTPADGKVNVNTYYYRSVGLGATATLNFTPDKRGLVPDWQVKGAKAFGDELRRQFATDKRVAATKGVQTGNTVELRWEKPRKIDRVVLMENIVNGQKVAKYSLEALVAGQWQPLIANNVHGYKSKVPAGYETIGHKKIDRVKPVTATGVRFRCLKSVAQPVELRSLRVYAPCDEVKMKWAPPVTQKRMMEKNETSGLETRTLIKFTA